MSLSLNELISMIPTGGTNYKFITRDSLTSRQLSGAAKFAGVSPDRIAAVHTAGLFGFNREAVVVTDDGIYGGFRGGCIPMGDDLIAAREDSSTQSILEVYYRNYKHRRIQVFDDSRNAILEILLAVSAYNCNKILEHPEFLDEPENRPGKDLTEEELDFAADVYAAACGAHPQKGYLYSKDRWVQYLQASVIVGVIDACFDLAYQYDIGQNGVKENKALAAQLYRYCAENGSGSAAGNLANFYYRGVGVEKDLEQAAKYYQIAIDNGSLKACNGMGLLYRDGKGGMPQDPERAAQLFRRAANGGSKSGMLNYGRCLENGTGVEKDEAEALRYYQMGAKTSQKCKEGWLRLDQKLNGGQAEIYIQACEEKEKKNYAEAVKLFCEAGEKGNVDSLRELGLMYIEGDGVSKNEEKACELFCLAVKKGDKSSLYYAGHLLTQLGVAADDLKQMEQGIAYLKKATENGDTTACMELATMFISQMSLTNDEFARQAALYLGKAASLNYEPALDSLKKMHDLGQVIDEYYYDALELVQDATDSVTRRKAFDMYCGCGRQGRWTFK